MRGYPFPTQEKICRGLCKSTQRKFWYQPFFKKFRKTFLCVLFCQNFLAHSRMFVCWRFWFNKELFCLFQNQFECILHFSSVKNLPFLQHSQRLLTLRACFPYPTSYRIGESLPSFLTLKKTTLGIRLLIQGFGSNDNRQITFSSLLDEKKLKMKARIKYRYIQKLYKALKISENIRKAFSLARRISRTSVGLLGRPGEPLPYFPTLKKTSSETQNITAF